MRNAKKTLSLVMIAIFTTFIVLSGIPAGAVTTAAAKAQVTKATAAVVKVEKTVKVSSFNPTTATTQLTAANKEVAKVKSLGKTYAKTYTALNTRAAAVAKKIAARKNAIAAQAAALAKAFADADKAVTAAENAVDGDKVDLVADEAALANAQGAVTAALEMVVKLNPNTANYKGLMARIDAANSLIVKAMDEVAAVKAEEEAAAAKKAAEEAAAKAEAEAVAAAETAVKATEDAVAAGQLTQAVDLAKAAVEKIAAVKDAEKVAAFNARLLALAPAKVASVTAVDGTITVNFDKKPLTTVAAADFVVTKAIGTAAATNVTPSAVTVVSNTAVTLAVPVTAVTTADQSVVYTVAYGTNAAVTAAAFTVAKAPALTVSSVAAINPNEIKVVFNTPVNETTAEIAANYTVYNGAGSAAPAYATMQADGVTVVLQFATALSTTYKVDVANVMDKFYQKMTAFSDTTKVFVDATAPALVSASYTGSVVKMTFNKPVTNGMTVKVDGVVIAGAGAATVAKSTLSADTALDYTVTAPLASATVGTHTLVLYNVSDTNTTANTVSIMNSTFAVTADTTIPKVVSTDADGSDTIDVQFNKVVKNLSGADLTNANFVVTKGTHIYSAAEVSVVKEATDGSLYYVTITPSGTTNPLYDTNATTTNINITVKNFTDASGYIGSTFSSTVTLTQDTTAPYVVASTLNSAVLGAAGSMTVHFNENLGATAYTSYITVKDSDGVIHPVTGYTVSGKDITLTFTGYTVLADVYTITFAAGAVYDLSDNGNAVATTTIDKSTSATYYDLAAGAVTVAANVITIDYSGAGDMATSAIDLANYTLDGVALPTGTTIGFYNNLQTVKITMPTATFSANTTALFGISKNVKTANGAYIIKDASGNAKSYLLAFTDNVKPVLASAKFIYSTGATSTTVIRLTFNEAMATITNAAAVGSDFAIVVAGVTVNVTNAVNTTGDAKSIDITIANPINLTQATTVTVKSSADEGTIDTTDLAANKLTRGTTVTVAQ